MDNLVYWIWLSLSCTPDTPTFAKLMDSYDNAEEVFYASEREIRACVGSNTSDCTALNNKDLSKAKEIYSFCMSKGVGIITYEDAEYPESLRDIPTPPVLLYYRGKLPNFNNGFRCAIVGTRSLSQYGRNNAFKLGYDMGCAGATVVSGMAIGIDGVAMAGAIAAGAVTIAVLGCGIDICYPSVHLKLAREIVKNGCIMTEYAPGTKPMGYNFPRRNRIISGLSAVTVIVEGKESSGAMLTARHAKAQGRTVYAFPGNVGSDGSQSTNLLIKNGAKLCTAADDIVRDYEMVFPGQLNPFLLKERMPVSMFDVLRDLKVSAVTPTDDIFKVPNVKKSQKKEEKSIEPPAVIIDENEAALDQPEFTADMMIMYKRIPPFCDHPIELLTDEGHNITDVNTILLKLQMVHFVEINPGGTVRRKIKES